MTEAVIVDAVRTPFGKGRPTGALAQVHPVDLLAHTLRAVVERSGVDPADLDDVIIGCVSQSSEQSANVARNAVLAAGFPERVPATTVDRQCGSSQQALHFAAQGVRAGSYDLVVAGGVESMSRVPMGSSVQGARSFGHDLAARYPDGLVPQGISAELIAAKWELTRDDLDRFGLRSQERAAAARDAGLLAGEIVPIKAANAEGVLVEVSADEGIRPTSLDRLAALAPAFESEAMARRFPQINWSVTAANSSQLTDGASALLVASSDRAAQLGLRPRATVNHMVVEGDDPIYMLTGIIPATNKVLARSGLSLADIDYFEVNEAFASVVLAWAKEVGADLDRVNVRGGAIAVGHPLGASGARLTASLLGTLEEHEARFGLQLMCEGGGMANATLIERLDP
ncbi:MAG TPA: thiolase family protein [Acidimicrobiales bacterium]|jgi:acetyl-CoA acyltransferase|nr:thiolase family protein [Acidimicrobiales bacterium]